VASMASQINNDAAVDRWRMMPVDEPIPARGGGSGEIRLRFFVGLQQTAAVQSAEQHNGPHGGNMMDKGGTMRMSPFARSARWGYPAISGWNKAPRDVADRHIARLTHQGRARTISKMLSSFRSIMLVSGNIEASHCTVMGSKRLATGWGE
jgi:hypothetical protein